ncbi:MAG: acyl-CoA dehydrogenase family protein [Acidimicrobiia bacterium]|nr:acyl-CoA dehydrogenase family protein [Acidimicrobiia bacterium]
MKRMLFDSEHELFRETVRDFIGREIAPNHLRWETDGKVDKSMFRAAGEQGLLGMAVPERFGGAGVSDFRFNVVISEETMAADVFGSGMCITLHNDVCLPYFVELATDDQMERWGPGLVDGSLMSAIAMTEPGAGSDLAGISTTATRDGDQYVVNGSKTFITNGINSDLVITAVKTDPTQRHAGVSLLVIEDGMEGFTRGRNLEKIGLHSQDTAELFFSDVHVPVSNLLGAEGRGFYHLVNNLPQERLSLAVGSLAHARTAFGWTLEYVKERKAFGAPIGSNQVIKHRLAEIATELDLGQAYLDAQVERLNQRELSAEDAAKSKWWCSELEKRVIDSCLQFYGGWGYMEEYPIARAYRDARVQTIYGGTTEIMKEIIGKSLGL